MAPGQATTSGIWDNHERGSVGDFLRKRIRPNADLSFVSAYFTIHAYVALKDELDQAGHLRFLYGDPKGIQFLDPEKSEKKVFRIEDDALSLANVLQQKRIAKECSHWLESKTDIRSVIKPGFLHGKMYHIDNSGVQEAIVGSSNFTVRGLGLGASGNNIELNLEVDSTRDRNDLKTWFDEVWDDTDLVEARRMERTFPRRMAHGWRGWQRKRHARLRSARMHRHVAVIPNSANVLGGADGRPAKARKPILLRNRRSLPRLHFSWVTLVSFVTVVPHAHVQLEKIA